MGEKRLNILIIEHDEDDVIILKDMLSRVPFSSVSDKWVAGYEEGLSSILSGQFDACLLDYRLGAASGLDFIKEAIKAGCDTPLILLTGHGDHGVDVEAMKAGASDYLVKGQFGPELLERSIRFGMESKRTERELRKARDELQLRIVELERTNRLLRREEARLEALLELNRSFADSSIEEMVGFVLEQQVTLTGSRLGFFGLIDEQGKFHLHTWSKGVVEQCQVKDPAIHLPIENAGIWAEAVRSREAIIVNHYSDPDPRKKGFPEGHLTIERFMAVPALDAMMRVEAVAVVANKGEDYDNSDLRQAVLFMEALWKLVQRQRSEKALREAETLVSLGKALSAVAHDIRIPLVAIGGFTKQVQRLLGEGSPGQQKLEIVLKETGRLEAILKDILFFSRPLQLERTRQDIGLVLEESISVVQPIARKRRVSITKHLPQLDSYIIDANRFKQAVINLLTNAVEASPERQEVGVSCRQEGTEFVLDIADCGPGIVPGDKTMIFHPFFTTKKSGTGLGLPITRKIIESHGGRIEALDNSPTGAIFRIRIPIKNST